LEIPAQLILLLLPSLIYLIVKKRQGEERYNTLVNLGWTSSKSIYFLQGLGMAIPIGVLMLVIMQRIPESVMENPMVSTSFYDGCARACSVSPIDSNEQGAVIFDSEDVFNEALYELTSFHN
jgi:hypothetical protein